MNFIGIEQIDILAHIRMVWETEIANLLTIREACDAPIYGSVAGDEPPPPPKTKMDYYFQLNTKHGISLQRAQYLFNGLSHRSPYWLDRYLKNICGMSDGEILPNQLALSVPCGRDPYA